MLKLGDVATTLPSIFVQNKTYTNTTQSQTCKASFKFTKRIRKHSANNNSKNIFSFPVSQKDNKFNPAEFTHRSYNEFTHINSVQTMKMGQKSWD